MGIAMKFRTKLIITFLIVILLPIFLSGVAFVAVGAMVLHNSDMNFQIEISDDSTLSDSLVSLSNTTNNLYIRLGNIAEKDAQKLEDRDFLEEVNGDALQVSSYIVVRKGTEEYYSGSEEMSRRFFSRLPAYGFENQDSYSGFYYNDAQKLVKQIDFVFSDGDEGSLFLVTRVNSVVSKSFLIYLFSAIVFILVLTSIVLTQWVYKGFFEPINRLNVAMQQITEGNFEYSLTSEDTNEIGELYRNYEDMRLRLKESTEEKIQNERQNRELVSNISHDLKTPITAIKGYVEGIMDGVADTPEKMDRYIKTIYTKANDMNRLINELTYGARVMYLIIPRAAL